MSDPHRRGRSRGEPRHLVRRGSTANQEGLRKLGDQLDMTEKEIPEPAVGGSQGATRVPNESGLVALGEEMQRAQGGRGRHRHRPVRSTRSRRVRRIVFSTLGALLVVVAGGAGYAYYITHDLNRVDVRGLKGALTTGVEAGTENILMVGSTSRCALSVQNPAFGICSQGVNGVNSDVIMILHADPAHHRLALLSIPRDLFIPNARSNGPNKIDAGLFQGLSQLVASIQEDFGIPIQHAVSLNFDQFANIVDALGGIKMTFPESVFDAESGLNIHAATCVHLDGTEALSVVRARHLQYDAPGTTSQYAEDWPQEAQSDLARIIRDHEFLRVLATAVTQKGLDNPISDIDLINSVKADVTFDQSWAVSDMGNLAFDFHGIDINAVPQLTIPVGEVTDPSGSGGSYVYEGSSYGDVEFPSESQDQSVIDQVLGVDAGTNSMTGDPLPAPSAVTVSVMNGTGAYNQATTTAAALNALGFDTVGVGDTAAVGDVAETVVYYGSLSSSAEAAAETVAQSISGSVIMAYDPSKVADGAQVTVVTGSQFAVNAPPATTTTQAGSATTPTAPTTTTTTTAPTSAAIAAPSASNPNLAPWDPRACPAGATPTTPVPNKR